MTALSAEDIMTGPGKGLVFFCKIDNLRRSAGADVSVMNAFV